jgi:hypothetical protein
MGILNRFFGGGKSIASVLISTQNNIFGVFGVAQPTDAQKLKASVYLCISGIAILNYLGGGKPHYAIDSMVDETRELTRPFSMQAKELSNNGQQLEKILAGFQGEAQVTESTRVNGHAAFEALYFSMGEELVSDILTHKGGPMGITGQAAIVVADGIFGEGKSKESFTEVSMKLQKFTNELIEVI